MKTNIMLLSLAVTTNLFAKLGDVNNDGTINLADCKLIAAQAALEIPTVDNAVADIDGDGTVTILDAMRLHQSMGGLWIEPTGKIEPVPQLSQEERAYFAQYEELCDRYLAMTPQAFLGQFPAAPAYASTLDPKECTYFTEIDTTFKLTSDQKTLLKEQGMVVLDHANTGQGFGGLYATIYARDLPVFFTSDALLDPLYKLYDDALKAVETDNLIPSLKMILSSTLSELDRYRDLHEADVAWARALADAETYLLVAQSLLEGITAHPDNGEVNHYLDLIGQEKLVEGCPFFGDTLAIDFSQFKPRSHYECLETGPCELSRYFKCMMWLGRADCAFNIDSLRQLRSFALIHSSMEKANQLARLSSINDAISFFVGDVDGFSLEGLSQLNSEKAFSIDSVIVSDNAAHSLLASIKGSGYANQLILSQAIWKNPDATRPDLPTIAQICGQRFILDSYLLGRTVEGYVKTRNKPLLEEVPFCLGNNAASVVVASDVTTYTTTAGDYKPYHARLGAARGLFEQYPYWEHNLYTLWLDGLRSLSQHLPSTVPVVMTSRTWQDKQMNTQLASWAQLRHNTLLYAKQSYTAGVTCFYPDGYIEPYPEFYRTIGEIVRRLAMVMPTAPSGFYFNRTTWLMVTDSLASMAELELQGKPLTSEHITFLNQMIVKNTQGMCGAPPYEGWYTQLFSTWDDCRNSRPSIADVHTIPPSIYSPSNMVLHAATGDASLVIIQAATGNNCGTLYAGAVASFYQHDETPIKRLADSEWKSMLNAGTKPGVPIWFAKYIK